MSPHVERASRWIYGGLWGVLVRWFKVPDHPPALPVPAGETMESFRPSEGFLRYLKFLFWIALTAFDVPLILAWLVIAIRYPVAGAILALPVLILAVVPDIVAYLAIHLRYDTTWYVMTSRSLRIRRGIWLLHETTITFENVQNVEIKQGPVQRYFGIADIHIDTAGGGGGEKGGKHQSLAAAGHRGLIEGVSDAPRIRDMILTRLKRSKKAGLGDEGAHEHAAAWTAQHVALLREIRDLVRA